MRIPSLILAFALLLTSLALAWPGTFQRAWISGRVTLAGKPAAGVLVMAMGSSGMAMTRSAANGNYSLGVGEGQWTLTATSEGSGLPKPVEVTLQAGEANETTDLALTPFPCVIRGTVVDEAGRTLAGASVVAAPFVDFEDESTEDEEETPMSTTPSYGTSDAKGRFSVGVPKGTWLLSASLQGYEMSPKNPPVRIPGMPEGMAPQIQGLVAKAPGAEVTIVLRPASAKTQNTTTPSAGDGGKVAPQPLALAGRACLSPGNVLHWTRTKERTETAGWQVKRVGPKGETVTLTVGEMGFLEEAGTEASVFSLTDLTAVPGTTYTYTVQEPGGPASNPVQLTTR